MIIDINDYKSIICLDGEFSVSFLKNFSLPIIAADGAANELLSGGVNPFVVIGDLDSANSKVLDRCNCIRIDDQNSTDFEKALFYAKKENLLPSIITGINGGCLDRILMNINVFSQTNSVFLSKDMTGLIISGHKELQMPVSSKISMFGINEAVVSSRGLRWELDNTFLSFGGFCSCSNRTIQENVSFDVKGKILAFVYITTTR